MTAQPFTPSVLPAILAGGPTRDRSEFFRRLFLLFAMGGLAGVTIARALSGEGESHLAIMAAATVGVGVAWIALHARPRLATWGLPLEALGLLGFALGLQDPLDWLGVTYLATQYRATFGSRRSVMVVAATYCVLYATGLGVAFGGAEVLRPITLVHMAAIVFGAYVASTLVAVLRGNQRRMEELRSSQEALRESEQRFRSVANCLREAVLITDTEDRIILANVRVRDVLGYEPDEVVGHIASELLLPASHRNVFNDRMRRRLSGETELYDAELIRKDGSTMFAEISASPYRDRAGRIVGTLGAISDISHRKRLEERLRQSMRLEAVGQLAGGVAHDFNNLLTVIKCHTELMRPDLPRQGPVRESLTEIERSVDKGATLIQQLLAFSRRQVLQPRRLTLARAIADATPLLRGMVRPGVGLVTCPEDPGEVFADPMQIEHVLVTLVRNANDASPDGGRIVLETRSRELAADDPRVVANEAAPGRYSVLVVSDNGTGMSTDVLKHIFEPFFTTKEPGEGSGLGLAGLYGIVRQSGGFVDVESAPAAGTTFRVYLPWAPWEAGIMPASPVPALQST